MSLIQIKNEFYLELDILIDTCIYEENHVKTQAKTNYHKVLEIVDQRLNDKRSLLVNTALCCFKTRTISRIKPIIQFSSTSKVILVLTKIEKIY
jgi:hypothetical protein